MPMYNRKCNYCGNDYYVCKSCVSRNSWKNVCCSVECFQKLFDQERQPAPIEQRIGGVLQMYGINKITKEKIKINGYDLQLGKFDCEDGTTKFQDNFESFEVSYQELKDIAKIK